MRLDPRMRDHDLSLGQTLSRRGSPDGSLRVSSTPGVEHSAGLELTTARSRAETKSQMLGGLSQPGAPALPVEHS